MMHRLLVLCVPTIVTIGMNGCSNSATSPETAQTEQAEHSHGEADTGSMEGMKAGLAKLSAEDAASAKKQHLCPVSGEMLGTMGTPKKVDVEGHEVWICCDNCKEALLADPEGFLAKLHK